MKKVDSGDIDVMGLIKDDVKITGIRKSKKILALFDSGANKNYIKKSLRDGDSPDNIGFHIFEGTHRAILANGDIAIGERVRFKEIRIKKRSVKEPSFVIMESLIEDIIIGVELMQKLGITLDPPNEKIGIR